METREDILKELRQIAPNLALLEKVNAYQAPDGYFLNFKNIMLEQVRPVDVKQELQVLAPSLLKLEKPLNAEIPAAYFTGFKSRLLDKVRADEVAKELAVVAPRLSVLEKVNVFEAPVNYFNSFPERVLGDIQAQKQAVVTDTRSWVDGLNEMLDGLISVVFKPKYSMAFAGFATVAIMAVFTFVKVQQCDDLDCRFAQLSNEEINSYLDNKSDAYSDEVFEMNLDTKNITGNPNLNNVHAYKDALNDVDDAALNDAITD
jgi:hypothetical protein